MITEKERKGRSGWLMIFGVIALFVVGVMTMLTSFGLFSYADMVRNSEPVYLQAFITLVVGILLIVAGIISCSGFVSLEPGQAKVCVLFGNYRGTIRTPGFYWVNPFYQRSVQSSSASASIVSGEAVSGSSLLASLTGNSVSTKVSLRARTLNGQRIKVNDRMGNPIEIATVVVWRVEDTARALFDVDNYASYVAIQAETALRHVASSYSYDHMEDDDAANTAITLRSNIEEVSQALCAELSAKLARAGVAVEDARLTHLAYAPEIASAMLRRQQAEAVIAARKKIVEGAVSMVDMALTQLSENGVVQFDEDRKAVMASNLMVVLCGETEAQPVVNAGSLYQ